MGHYRKSAEKGKSDNNTEMRALLEKYIEGAAWIQAIGQLSEAILLSKLLPLSEDPDSPGEHKIVSGAWTQAIGLILIGLGATIENSTDNERLINFAKKGSITGSYLQGIGATVVGIGGTEVLQSEASMQTTEFIP